MRRGERPVALAGPSRLGRVRRPSARTAGIMRPSEPREGWEARGFPAGYGQASPGPRLPEDTLVKVA